MRSHQVDAMSAVALAVMLAAALLCARIDILGIVVDGRLDVLAAVEVDVRLAIHAQIVVDMIFPFILILDLLADDLIQNILSISHFQDHNVSLHCVHLSFSVQVTTQISESSNPAEALFSTLRQPVFKAGFQHTLSGS